MYNVESSKKVSSQSQHPSRCMLSEMSVSYSMKGHVANVLFLADILSQKLTS
jgi:hypothetical protein